MRPMSVTTTGVQDSAAIPLDCYGWPNISLQAVVTGTATYTVQQTLDEPGSANATWFDHPDTGLVGATANKQGAYSNLPTAIRLRQTAGSGSVKLTVMQVGSTPA